MPTLTSNLLSQPAASASASSPIVWPIILTVSIALLSVLPLAACAAALVWAVTGLLGLPVAVVAGADAVVVAAMVVASAPLLVRVFRQERQEAAEARRNRAQSASRT